MDWNLFWTAFGAIGGLVCAIATAVAVIASLWQTKYSQKKKLKLYFTDNSIVSNGITKESENFISLSVTNVGNRKVIIEAWGIKFGKNESMFVLLPNDASKFESMLYKQLPQELDLEENIGFYMSKKRFVNFLNDNKIKNYRRIKVYVRDTAGVKYIKKIKKTVKKIKTG